MYRTILIPSEVYDELGFTDDMILEAYSDGDRLIIQRMDDFDDECIDCEYYCPNCDVCNAPDGYDCDSCKDI